MVNLLSSFALAICGALLIIRCQKNKKELGFDFIMTIWTLLMAGINLAKFFKG